MTFSVTLSIRLSVTLFVTLSVTLSVINTVCIVVCNTKRYIKTSANACIYILSYVLIPQKKIVEFLKDCVSWATVHMA